MKELWKPHPTLPLYVSTYGNVYHKPHERDGKRLPLKRLLPQYSDAGYRMLRMKVNKKLSQHPIGRLVLETFIGPQPKGQVCVHGELGSDDDRLTNVVWAKRGTRREKATSLAKRAAEQFLADPGECIALTTGAGFMDGDEDREDGVDIARDGPGYKTRKTYRGPVHCSDRRAGTTPVGLRRYPQNRASKVLQDHRAYYR